MSTTLEPTLSQKITQKLGDLGQAISGVKDRARISQAAAGGLDGRIKGISEVVTSLMNNVKILKADLKAAREAAELTESLQQQISGLKGEQGTIDKTLATLIEDLGTTLGEINFDELTTDVGDLETNVNTLSDIVGPATGLTGGYIVPQLRSRSKRVQFRSHRPRYKKHTKKKGKKHKKKKPRRTRRT
jgi:uncharacterized protein YoxC